MSKGKKQIFLFEIFYVLQTLLELEGENLKTK